MADILRIRSAPGEPWTEIPVIQGPQGLQGEQGLKGEKGDPGDTYVLTAADKQEIANMALELLPSAEGVSY